MDNEENVERVGTNDQHLMDIDTSVNVEDIPVDPSAQPQEGHQQQDDNPS